MLTNDSDTEKIESYYSTYQARPLYYQVGIAAESNDTTEDVSADVEPGIIPEPTWL